MTSKRPLVRTIYRSIMRVCNALSPNLPFARLVAEGVEISDHRAMKQLVRDSFRRELRGDEQQERISEGISALRRLTELKPTLEKWVVESDSQSTNVKEQYDATWVNSLIDSVDWLPTIEQSILSTTLTDVVEDKEDTKFPLFPLSGPLFSPSGPLPLFTSVSDIPFPGMEIQLKIFEPRYRQLYQDLLTKSTSRKFVVPFSHPTEPFKYAAHGLLYEVMNVKEVADETNGVIQYLANHLVTKPVHISRIVNPEAWGTKETYLQIEGRVVNDHFVTDLEDLKHVLKGFVHPIAVHALGALMTEGLWGFVRVWTSHIQQELLRLQIEIAAQAEIQSAITDEKLEELQKDHRSRLIALHLDMALLIPTLLQSDSKQKVEYLIQVIAKEREYQEKKKA